MRNGRLLWYGLFLVKSISEEFDHGHRPGTPPSDTTLWQGMVTMNLGQHTPDVVLCCAVEMLYKNPPSGVTTTPGQLAYSSATNFIPSSIINHGNKAPGASAPADE